MRTWKKRFMTAGLMLALGSLSACYYGPGWGGPGWHHHDGGYYDHGPGPGPGGPGFGPGPGHGPY
jgi:hypothetical protein